MEKYTYDVAISFAEQDRNAALALSLALEMQGFPKVYYYPDHLSDTVGRELKEKLTEIYSKEARFSIVLLSKHYFKKEFTKVEFNAIMTRVKNETAVYMIPVVLPSFNPELLEDKLKDIKNMGYVQWNHNPKNVAGIMKKVLGKSPENLRQETPPISTIREIHTSQNVKNYGKSVNQVITMNNN
jgi:hypothetical protein